MGTVVLLRNAMSALMRAVPTGTEELSEAAGLRDTHITGGHKDVTKVSARWHDASCNGQTPRNPIANQPHKRADRQARFCVGAKSAKHFSNLLGWKSGKDCYRQLINRRARSVG